MWALRSSMRVATLSRSKSLRTAFPGERPAVSIDEERRFGIFVAAAHVARQILKRQGVGMSCYREVGRGGGGGTRPDPGHQVTMSILGVVCPAVTATIAKDWSGHGPPGVLRRHSEARE